MGLPRIVEYLESVRTPGYGSLVEHENTQLIVPSFPPGITLTAQIKPPQGRWGMFCFHISFGTMMIPNVFQGAVQHGGKNHYTGVISGSLLNQGLDIFILVTEGNPLVYQETNVSALNQYFEIDGHFLTISDEDDYLRALDRMDKLGGIR